MNLTPYSFPPRGASLSPEVTATFFAAVPPPWEDLAAQELREKLALLHYSCPEISVLPGGLEFTLPMRKGFILNHYLKIPTRLLLRVASFKCRDFPRLFQKCSAICWGQMLNQPPKISFSAEHSRLINSEKAAKAVQDAVRHSWRHAPPSPGNSAATIFVRLVNDMAFISVDTSGERLDRRHYRTKIGRAPLRENLAAAMLYQLALLGQAKNLPLLHLFSPMCGAGTFLTEAASFYHPLAREYAYQKFPLAKKVMIPPAPQTPLTAQLFAPGGSGMDIDHKVLAAAQANEAALGQRCSLVSSTWQQGDVFQVKANLDHTLPWAIIINPPLNQRLKVPSQDFPKGGKKLFSYYAVLAQTMFDFYHPRLLGMLMPAQVNPANFSLPPALAFPTFMGGRKTIFACWAK